jgi:hypothetical protein
MRQDQYERLQALSEQLADVFIQEGDPANWPGAGVAPAELSKDQRGDRYWCKKNAFATVSLIQRVGGLVAIIQDNSNAGAGAAVVNEEEASLDAEVKAAEAMAKELMERLAGKGKAEFDKRVRGKA